MGDGQTGGTEDGQHRHFVAETSELTDGDRVIVDVEGLEIAVFNAEGSYHAVANYCIHQGGPLCEGTIGGYLTMADGELAYRDGGKVICCPWHGWEFNIETGQHVSQERYRIPTYEVAVEDGKVYVDAP